MQAKYKTIGIAVMDGAAVLAIDNPPVNQMSPQLSRDLSQAVDECLASTDIKALILTGTGKNFVAGADITELQRVRDSGAAFQLAWTAAELFGRIESGPKPVIAAINGNALGGGLELAMACHYRVGIRGAHLGLPEVQLGVIPGAGGIQRLPRLIGLQHSLGMIAVGQPIPAEKALSIGLLDELAGADALLQTCRNTALRFISGELDRQKHMTGSRRDRLPGDEEKNVLIEDFKARNSPKFKGTIAPFKALEALEQGLTDDAEADIRRDVGLFSECAVSEQAKNLIGVFLNTRAAGRLPRIEGIEPARIKKAAMLGGGVMGSGIVHLLIGNGFDTILWDINEEAIEKGLEAIRKSFAFPMKQGKMTAQDSEKLLEERLAVTTSLEDLKEADLIIEAVPEDMKIKQGLWEKLEALCKPATLFATNTSALPLTETASVLRHPDRMIGLHFFNPAQRMQLLEIICAAKTSNQTLAAAVAFARAIKKTPVVVNDGPGFYVTRQLMALFAGHPYLLADGVNAEQIEKAVKAFGMPMGPAELDDRTGIDIAYHVRKAFERRLGDRYAVHPLTELIHQTGCYGRKTGTGYMDYTGERPVPNKMVVDVVQRFLRENNVSPRQVSDQEIIDTMLALGINEAALMIEEGICDRPQDMDLAMIYGAGFPSYRGGILRYADRWGPTNAYNKLIELENRYGLRFKPAGLLKDAADSGRTFYGD
ncbi:MAG: 3-hydroxyacyl-CoA dehydrogenase NAD-binding domain-containing protein [Pseudomonadota bacterium]